MLEILLFAVALTGAAIGGWIDLKTTEVPDIVPLGMSAAGLAIHIAQAYFAGSLFPIHSAVAVSLGYLVFGYILYFTGQWGEADVLLLGAVGFVLPLAPPFFNATASSISWTVYPLIFLLNTFIVGGIYSVLYAFAIAARSKDIKRAFYADIAANAKSLGRITLLFLAGALAIAAYFSYRVNLPISDFAIRALIILPAFAGLFLIYRFALVVDRNAFRRKVSSGELKEGDVLAESVKVGSKIFSGKLFVGLKQEDIKKIQKAKKSVLVKEGIRYGPTFFLALIATWLFGNLIMLAVL